MAKNIMKKLEEALLERIVNIEFKHDVRHCDYYVYMTPWAYEEFLSHINGYYVPSHGSKMEYDIDTIEVMKWHDCTLYFKVDDVKAEEGFSVIPKGFGDEGSKV
jgi:hypothetical protein